ncbi:MAG TPA: membrane protein insertase YidC [Thermotogota bacterium]|nr:membrane protein insertase YidC [Thermotogota bacterium]HPJ88136.1 membrane protein insertase YidC [Thermotogota bacterium]HPR95568.1 membrane protein insertase YidC [Thermotogota bacterium]
MKLNKITVLFLILSLFAVIGFAANETEVTYLDGMLSVKSRIASYVFDVEKGLLNEVTLTIETQNVIYRNDHDGFYTTINATEVYPSNVTVNGVAVEEMQNKTEKLQKDIEIVFDYGDFQKRVTIPYGPYYVVDLAITGIIPDGLQIAFPRVGFTTEDRVSENGLIMTNYYEKTKGLVIWVIEDGNDAHYKIDGRGNDNVVDVPYDGMSIHGYMGPAKKVTFINKAFPNNNVWISRVVNSYPGASSWYDPIFYLFVGLIDWLKSWTGNYGWSIIIFTIIVRLLMYPLMHAQNKSMIDRKKLEKDPKYIKIMSIEDKQKKQEALMKFYQENKINPASGCLPLLIQMPIFFLLYAVIRYQSELYAFGGSFLIWQDLSVGGFVQNIWLVLIAVLVGFFNALITSSEAKMALQGVLMGALFPFMFIGLPTGLQLYWVSSQVLQFGITYYVYKRNDVHGLTVKGFFEGIRRK